MKISYPFFHADRIKTPTLFMCGEKDFNVPLLGSEQMYQALRSLGVDTQLVIYPGQFHGITTPSYKTIGSSAIWTGTAVPDAATTTTAGDSVRSSALRLVDVAPRRPRDRQSLRQPLSSSAGALRLPCCVVVRRSPSTAPDARRMASARRAGIRLSFGHNQVRSRVRRPFVRDARYDIIARIWNDIRHHQAGRRRGRYTGRIIQRIEEAGFPIRAMRLGTCRRRRPKASTPSTASGRSSRA